MVANLTPYVVCNHARLARVENRCCARTLSGIAGAEYVESIRYVSRNAVRICPLGYSPLDLVFFMHILRAHEAFKPGLLYIIPSSKFCRQSFDNGKTDAAALDISPNLVILRRSFYVFLRCLGNKYFPSGSGIWGIPKRGARRAFMPVSTAACIRALCSRCRGCRAGCSTTCRISIFVISPKTTSFSGLAEVVYC